MIPNHIDGSGNEVYSKSKTNVILESVNYSARP